MTERTEGRIHVEAAPAAVMAVLADVGAYPEWARGIRSAEVLVRDARGRPAEAAFHVVTPPIEARYTLRYRYAARAAGMSWTTVAASGAVRGVHGEYVLAPADGGTDVTYRLAMEPAIALPGFLRRRAERTIIDAALGGLKRRVEVGER